MLWGEFKLSEDCSGCPLLLAELCSSVYTSYGGDPVEPPCTYFEDDVDLNEWVKQKNKQILDFEDREDRKIRQQKEKDKKNKIRQERRKESQNYVWAENLELKKLSERLRFIDFRIDYLKSFNDFSSCFNTSSTSDINEYMKEKEVILIKIEKVKNIKKIKLAELRKKRK